MSPGLPSGRLPSAASARRIGAALGLVALAGAVPARGDQRVVGSVAPIAGVGVAPSGAVSAGDRYAVDVTRVRVGGSLITTVVSH